MGLQVFLELSLQYMPAVLDMLREFGLEESVRQSQDFCFGQFHSLWWLFTIPVPATSHKEEEINDSE